MDEVKDKLEKFEVMLDAFLDGIPEEEKTWVAHALIFDILYDCTDNHLETLGFLQSLIFDANEMFNDHCKDCAKEQKEQKRE